MKWNAEQDAVLKDLSKFLRDKDRKFYHLRGRAGTGKTTLAAQVRNDSDLSFIALAYTGKAASRLRAKGWENAATIHSKLYLPGQQSRARLKAWKAELEEVGAKVKQGYEKPDMFEKAEYEKLKAAYTDLKKKIADEEEALKNPSFIYNQETCLKDYDAVVVDEVSMLGYIDGENMVKAANEGGFKMILMGDDNQLPPVKSRAYFMESKPDFMLTQIMRQHQDNPIIRMADYIIENRRCPPLGSYGDSRVVERFTADECLECDQLLVGRNATRQYYNQTLRKLRGYTDVIEVGEKLICLSNSRDGYFNGTRWYVQDVYDENSYGDKIEVRLSSDDDGEPDRDAWLHIASLKGEDVPFTEREGAQCMVSAEALTVHKFQGSEGKHIVLLDESYCSKADAWRWLYTGATRAQERLTISQKG